jgi:hypothetical protein
MWQMCYNEPRLGGALRTVFRIRTKKKAATSSQAMVPWRQAQPVWAITTTLAGVHTGAQFRWYRSNAALPEIGTQRHVRTPSPRMTHAAQLPWSHQQGRYDCRDIKKVEGMGKTLSPGDKCKIGILDDD